MTYGIHMQALGALVCLFLAGCETVPELRADREPRTDCCDSVLEVPTIAIIRGLIADVRIDPSGPRLKLDDGGSPVVALALPNRADEIELQFMTGVSAGANTGAGVFVPYFLFLDSHRKPVSDVFTVPLYAENRIFRPELGAYWSGKVPVPLGVTYVLVVTRPGRLGDLLTHERYRSTDTLIISPVPVYIRGKPELVSRPVRMSPSGVLRLRLM